MRNIKDEFIDFIDWLIKLIIFVVMVIGAYVIIASLLSCTKQETPCPKPETPVSYEVDLNNTEWLNIDTTLYDTTATSIYFDNGGGSYITTGGEYWHIEWRIEGGKVTVYIHGWHMPIDESWYGEFTADGILFNNELLFIKQ